jgi:hypothetical protein
MGHEIVEGLVAPKNTPSPAKASPESRFAHDLVRPSFARRSGLREGGKPVPIPDQVEDMLFGIMR